MKWNYKEPSIIKVGDVYEYCFQNKGESSQIHFGVVVSINKENKTFDFEKLHNTGQIKNGKPFYKHTGILHKNIDAVRRAVHLDTWR